MSDQVDDFRDTPVSSEGRVVVLFDNIHTVRFRKVDEVSVKQGTVGP